jgi:hypothetical protein
MRATFCLCRYGYQAILVEIDTDKKAPKDLRKRNTKINIRATRPVHFFRSKSIFILRLLNNTLNIDMYVLTIIIN